MAAAWGDDIAGEGLIHMRYLPSMCGIAGLRVPGRRLQRDHRTRWSLRLRLSFALLTGLIGAPGAAYGLGLRSTPCPAGRQRTATEVRFR